MPEEPIKIRNLGTYGLIREASVDSNQIPDGALVDAVNVHFDRIGAVILRPGLVKLGTGVLPTGNPCLGLFNALFSTSGSNRLLAVFSMGGSNGIFSFDGTDWTTSLSGETNSEKIRFVVFSDRTVRVLGGNQSAKMWRGASATWETSGSPLNPDKFPASKYIEVYKNRVYLAGETLNPDRLYFSGAVTSTGTINWNPPDDFIDINPNDGENITALKRFGLELLVFKPNYIYRFRTSALDPDPLIRIGTRSQESIIEGKRGIYFHHETGFFKYSGATPQEISKPISDILEAIPLSYMDDISSWKDQDHIYWSVGDLTIDGEDWKNVVCRYTESTQLWTVYSYYTEIKWGSDYNNGTTLTRVIGDDTGNVATFNSGQSDIGYPIFYRFVTKWYDFGLLSIKKLMQELTALCEKAQGAKLMYQTDENPTWNTLGELRKFITNFEPLSVSFNRIRFKVIGASTQEAFIFLGIEIPKILAEGIIFEESK